MAISHLYGKPLDRASAAEGVFPGVVALRRGAVLPDLPGRRGAARDPAELGEGLGRVVRHPAVRHGVARIPMAARCRPKPLRRLQRAALATVHEVDLLADLDPSRRAVDGCRGRVHQHLSTSALGDADGPTDRAARRRNPRRRRLDGLLPLRDRGIPAHGARFSLAVVQHGVAGGCRRRKPPGYPPDPGRERLGGGRLQPLSHPQGGVRRCGERYDQCAGVALARRTRRRLARRLRGRRCTLLARGAAIPAVAGSPRRPLAELYRHNDAGECRIGAMPASIIQTPHGRQPPNRNPTANSSLDYSIPRQDYARMITCLTARMSRRVTANAACAFRQSGARFAPVVEPSGIPTRSRVTLADPKDVAGALASGLRYRGRKRVRDADVIMAWIVAGRAREARGGIGLCRDAETAERRRG